jgi:fatty-acyl-CoA synthase
MSGPKLIQSNSSAYQYPLLIKQLLHVPLETRPEQEIIYSDVTRQDYWTLRHRIGQLASFLKGAGVEAGSTVAVMDWDSHRYLECYFAIPMMGAILMTANLRLSQEQIIYTLNDSGAKTLLINAEFLELFASIRSQLVNIDCFILLDDNEIKSVPRGFLGEYEDLLSNSSPDFVFPDFDENTWATTFYTTGTTGLPKGVSFSHRQLVLHTLSAASALTSAPDQGRIHRDDVYMPMTPMYHVHAWGMPYVATMLGLKQVYPGRYTAEGILELIAREKVSFSHGVPTLLQMILSCPAVDDVDLNGWKVIVGGSSLSRGLAQAALERGIDVFGGYGMSETCPLLTLSHVKAGVPRGHGLDIELRMTAGLPIPLVDLRVVDKDMRDVARDGKTAGAIVARAPWLTQGYMHNQEASEQLWLGGYLHTNDIGVIDKDGYLKITDRVKDMIKTGGEWVSSLELEEMIAGHVSVSEVAVIGIADPKWGERPLPIIVLKDGYPADEQAIRKHLREYAIRGVIPKFALPDRIAFVEKIEKTSVGKVDKKLLREKYRSAA